MTIERNCSVPGADCIKIELEPGDKWPLPYRGAKYAVKLIDQHLCVNWTRHDAIISTSEDNFPGDLILALRNVGKDRGSFVITAHNEILTKVQDDNGDWIPYYVGKYDDCIEFEKIDLNPRDLEQGMYWTGIPFKSGETWCISPRPGMDNQLMWRRKGITFGSDSRHPELFKTYLDIRPSGGRLYFTPSGNIWMNLNDDGVSYKYAEDFKEKQIEQVNRLYSEKNDTLLRLIEMRIGATHGFRPIYLGHVSDFDDGTKPRTFFSHTYKMGFGGNGEDGVDEASWDDVSWNMR